MENLILESRVTIITTILLPLPVLAENVGVAHLRFKTFSRNWQLTFDSQEVERWLNYRLSSGCPPRIFTPDEDSVCLKLVQFQKLREEYLNLFSSAGRTSLLGIVWGRPGVSILSLSCECDGDIDLNALLLRCLSRLSGERVKVLPPFPPGERGDLSLELPLDALLVPLHLG